MDIIFDAFTKANFDAVYTKHETKSWSETMEDTPNCRVFPYIPKMAANREKMEARAVFTDQRTLRKFIEITFEGKEYVFPYEWDASTALSLKSQKRYKSTSLIDVTSGLNVVICYEPSINVIGYIDNLRGRGHRFNIDVNGFYTNNEYRFANWSIIIPSLRMTSAVYIASLDPRIQKPTQTPLPSSSGSATTPLATSPPKTPAPQLTLVPQHIPPARDPNTELSTFMTTPFMQKLAAQRLPPPTPQIDRVKPRLEEGSSSFTSAKCLEFTQVLPIEALPSPSPITDDDQPPSYDVPSTPVVVESFSSFVRPDGSHLTATDFLPPSPILSCQEPVVDIEKTRAQIVAYFDQFHKKPQEVTVLTGDAVPDTFVIKKPAPRVAAKRFNELEDLLAFGVRYKDGQKRRRSK